MISPTLPATLPERLYLLTYDRGRERLTAQTWAGYLLRAGALAELRSRGLVQERDGKVIVVAALRRLDDSVLGPVLESIAAGSPKSWSALIRRDRRALEDAVVASLESGRWITVQRPRTRWRRVRLDIRDPRVLSRLAERFRVTIQGSSPIARVDENDAALVALAAVGQLRAAISKSQAREHAGRIAALTARTEPIAGALRHTLQAAKSAAASG